MSVSPPPRLLHGVTSDVGRKRHRNQDRYLTAPDVGLFLVVDGVGGQAAGEVAAEMTVESVGSFIRDTILDAEKTWPFGLDPTLSEAGNRLRAAVLVANHDVARRVREDSALTGMAATACAVLVSTRRDTLRASVAHVGDCRVYLLRDGTLAPLTRDHSWVAEQVAAGVLDAAAAETHPNRHLVTRAIAGDTDLVVDVQDHPLRTNDVLVLCSDGLHGPISDGEIQSILQESPLATDEDVQAACDRLVALANDHGGPDNVTALVARVPEPL